MADSANDHVAKGTFAVDIAGLGMADLLIILAAQGAMIETGEEVPIVKGNADLLICEL